jgi:hypothetical protein
MRLPRKNLIMSATLLTVLLGVTIHQIGEIGASDYRVLRNGFKQGTPAYRAAIAAAMRSGEINRWEYRNLLDRYRNELRASLIDNDAVNLREERLVLAAMTRHAKLP